MRPFDRPISKGARRKGVWREGMWLIVSAVLLLCGLLLPMHAALALSETEKAVWQASETGELVRMHVVAHSDSPYDQSVKLAVRDAVLDAFSEIFAYAAKEGGSEDLYVALQTHLTDIEAVALRRARELGFQGEVRAEAGCLCLPEKRFGALTLPEGTYRSLRITLGSGEGRNWWCVLYPRLCAELAKENGMNVQLERFHWTLPQIFGKWLLLSEADML